MKWLKLFEGFSEDFYKRLEDIEKEYSKAKKDHLKSTKETVDQYLFDLTDNWTYSTQFVNDVIEDEDLSLFYHFKCSGKDFIDFWESVLACDENLRSELGLKIKIKIDGYFGVSQFNRYGFLRKHELLHGRMADLKEMQEYVDSMNSLKPEVLGKPLDYDHFIINVNIVPI
jgi:hypothetical protein